MSRPLSDVCNCFGLVHTREYQRYGICLVCNQPRWQTAGVPQADGDGGDLVEHQACSNYELVKQLIAAGKYPYQYAYGFCVADRTSGCYIQCGIRCR